MNSSDHNSEANHARQNIWTRLFGWFACPQENNIPNSTLPIGYQPFEHPISISEHGRRTCQEILGERQPAIFLHAVMPRSGSVHVGNLIRLHPDLADYPNDIWEFPFLCSTNSLGEFQDNFFSSYSQNDGKIAKHDFAALLAASSLKYLQDFEPSQRLFIKEPRAHFLDLFFELFPGECLVLLMRDGRDVVNSTIKSWPEKDFAATCQEWNQAAMACERFRKTHAGRTNQFLFVKFEEILKAPQFFVKAVCDAFDLDYSKYPLNQIDDLPVQGSSALKTAGQVSWEPQTKTEEFNPIGRWQSWSSDKKSTFKTIAGETLVTLGYEANLDW